MNHELLLPPLAPCGGGCSKDCSDEEECGCKRGEPCNCKTRPRALSGPEYASAAIRLTETQMDSFVHHMREISASLSAFERSLDGRTRSAYAEEMESENLKGEDGDPIAVAIRYGWRLP